MCVLEDLGRRAPGQLQPPGRPLAGCRSWTRAQRPESQSPQAGGSGNGDPRPGLAVSPVSKQASVQAGGGGGGGERLGTVTLRYTLGTPLCSPHSLLVLVF